MKKLICVFAAALMFLGVFTACTDKPESDVPPQEKETDNATDSQDGVINPLVESDADGVVQQLGFALELPDDAENVEYFILSGDTEELRFSRNGLDYIARLKATADFEDISGLYYPWTNTFDDEIKGCKCRLMRYNGDEGDIDLCLWYDAVPGLMYSLTTSDRSLDGFDITAVALQVFSPVQNNIE